MTATPPWLPSAIVPRRPADLHPAPTNARTHNKAQVAALAASIQRFGFPVPILIDEAGMVIAGHGRLLAAKRLKLDQVPTITIAHLSEAQRRAYTLADNQLAGMSDWDEDKLDAELRALKDAADVDLAGLGFDELLAGFAPTTTAEQRDAVPAVAKGAPVSQRGACYQLGPHVLMCGDSIVPADVEQLLAGAAGRAPLVHADPPYGMGKEADGVENDNLYRDKLDAFQMAWWHAWRPYLADNGAAYVWGNAADLWRLWYQGGLGQVERLTLRNEIVWDKENATGMSSDEMRSYPVATERCLYFMLGDQGFGNVNKDDFWSGFEPLRAYLETQVKAMAWLPADVRRITGVGMYGHWFSKSQWHMIPANHYEALRQAAEGKAFTRPYPELRREYDGGLQQGDHLAAKHAFYGLRAYFDNTHDNMTDVWRFARVIGEERHGHATPKPVDMIARALTSSCPPGGLVLEPFAGTGTTLIAAAVTGRVCRTMEIKPEYCDVIRRRWTTFAKVAGLDAGSGALV